MTGEILFGRFNTALASFGALATAYFCLKFIIFMFKSIKMFLFRLGLNPKKYGSWAVITGATDGIGKAYAEQLAAKGLNVVLLSRTKSKLKEVAAEIETKYKVETQIVAVDFTSGSEIYKDVRKKLDGLEIGVLVNNVGMSYPFPQYFHELEDPEKLIPAMININCLAATMMTSIILPSMLKRKKGLIINIASASGSLPCGLLSLYSATKAFMDFFSRSLNSEYASQGIIVQSVLPYFVVSKLSKIRKSSLTVPTAPSYVSSALATLGNESRTFGCFMHNLQNAVVSSVPEAVSDYISKYMHLAIRKSALKKKQQQEQKSQ